METNKILYKILEILDGKGFVLYYYKAYSTSSCYIKLDFGVCQSIRISDHKGIEKYKYTFNLLLDIDKSYKEDNRNYYCLKDLDIMIKDIVKYKKDLEEKYGFNYFQYMLNNKNMYLNKYKGFWQNAKNYNDF